MSKELKSYEEYKKINLPWLESIPKHWSETRNKNVLRLRRTVVGEKKREYLLLSLTTRGIIARDLENAKGKFPKDFSTYQEVNINDLVFCLFDVDETPRTVGLSPLKGMITGAYTVFRPININEKYIYYYYLSLDQYKSLRPLYTGLRKVINTDLFLRTKMPCAPKDEQGQIVRYLDYNIAKINKFIKAKKKLIELLKEEKQAIINNAVTKGINPNVKMKNSGVEWIGDMPEHWEVRRCKFLFSETDKRSESGLETHLSMSQQYGLIPNSEIEERRLISESYVGAKLCDKNDLVLNRLKAHLGVFALAPQSGLVSPDYTVLRSNINICPKYAEYTLKSGACRKELRIRVRGIVEGFWRLYTDDFYNIVIPLPSLEEQKDIVDFINKRSNEIDAMITKTLKQIDFITEYRTRLISDVVTGKVDVRNIEIPNIVEEGLEIEEELTEELVESEEE